jgi:heme exporter protein CcmD
MMLLQSKHLFYVVFSYAFAFVCFSIMVFRIKTKQRQVFSFLKNWFKHQNYE